MSKENQSKKSQNSVKLVIESNAREVTDNLIKQFETVEENWRENVQNSSDANANLINIVLGFLPYSEIDELKDILPEPVFKQYKEQIDYEKLESITDQGFLVMSCDDDGDGMDHRDRKEFLLKLFSSGKEDDASTTGRFGIGVVSNFAYKPGLFYVESSRKKDNWKFVINCLDGYSLKVFENRKRKGTKLIMIKRGIKADDLEHYMLEARDSVKKFCKYKDVPIYVNNEKINEPFDIDSPLKVRFGEKGVEGIIALSTESRYELLNNRILIKQGTNLIGPAYGDLEILVSSRHLDYNLSRNDIIKNKIYKHVISMVEKHVGSLAEFVCDKIPEFESDYKIVDKQHDEAVEHRKKRFSEPFSKKISELDKRIKIINIEMQKFERRGFRENETRSIWEDIRIRSLSKKDKGYLKLQSERNKLLKEKEKISEKYSAAFEKEKEEENALYNKLNNLKDQIGLMWSFLEEYITKRKEEYRGIVSERHTLARMIYKDNICSVLPKKLYKTRLFPTLYGENVSLEEIFKIKKKEKKVFYEPRRSKLTKSLHEQGKRMLRLNRGYYSHGVLNCLFYLCKVSTQYEKSNTIDENSLTDAEVKFLDSVKSHMKKTMLRLAYSDVYFTDSTKGIFTAMHPSGVINKELGKDGNAVKKSFLTMRSFLSEFSMRNVLLINRRHPYIRKLIDLSLTPNSNLSTYYLLDLVSFYSEFAVQDMAQKFITSSMKRFR